MAEETELICTKCSRKITVYTEQHRKGNSPNTCGDCNGLIIEVK